MKRLVGSKFPALLSLVLAGSFGCGGGDKGDTTTPAATEPPAEAAPPAEAPAEAPVDPSAPPAGGGLTEQLAQANKVWADSCTTCHGDNGEGKGKKNPPVVGTKALTKFKTGADLLTYVKEKMPKDDPGSLSESDYLAVTAWLLSKNAKLGETNDALTPESAAAIKLQ
jgi:alcohol dehydrogenase (cytochrome c)